MIYCYAKSNQMKGHRFNDDVALCRAKNKEEAFKIFIKYYGNATLKDISRVFNTRINNKPYILTDY